MHTENPRAAGLDTGRERRAFARTMLPSANNENWCSMRTGTGESATAQVLDITREGCRLQIASSPNAACLARLELGDWVEFMDWTCQASLEPLAGMRAEVVWAEGRELGCRFERRLDMRELGATGAGKDWTVAEV